MSSLADRLRREIARHGAISFARFMELALYSPEGGYYERHSNPIGRRGDFLTSVSAGPLFGRLLAFQFAEWFARTDSPQPPWIILEAGAHDGQLAHDILSWLAEHRRFLFNAVEYRILEPSSRRTATQRKALQAYAAYVRWFSSWEEVPPVDRGIIFSNELLDAFPVHRLGWDARQNRWFEWGVTQEQSGFRWVRLDPEASSATGLGLAPGLFWPDLHPDLLAVLPDGFSTEVCPAAAAWWKQAAAALGSGCLLTIDYGFTSEEFFLPHRADGTLRAYAAHHLSPDVLARPGEQDLTAHVNFTALRRAGEEAGLQTICFASQPELLVRIAEKAWKPDAGFGPWGEKENRQFQTLVHPEHLGRGFKVLAQARGP
jgi:SAM-dependent MidA family methyltransferase